MRVVQINSVCDSGSTGRIAGGISDVLTESGIENYIVYSVGNSDRQNAYKMGNTFESKLHAMLSRLFGLQGYFSYYSTKEMLKLLDKIKPDYVQLHNLHANYINMPMLFKYLAKNDIATVITLHDTFMYTGKCVYYTMADCQRWTESCGKCPQLKSGNKSWLLDRTKKLLSDKKNWYSYIKKLIVVGVSDWITAEAKKSVLGNAYVIKTIHNGIDLEKFKPVESKFRIKNNLKDKKIILAVANVWEKRKGLKDIIRLSNRLGNDYKIVVVGRLSGDMLPDNILYIPRTESQTELAEIYTAADIFINPTYEDNFPTVNLEALACGTPVVTYNTGGSPEALNEKCGAAVRRGDVNEMEREIKRVCEEKPYSKEECIARAKMFDMNDKFKEYVELYKSEGKE